MGARKTEHRAVPFGGFATPEDEVFELCSMVCGGRDDGRIVVTEFDADTAAKLARALTRWLTVHADQVSRLPGARRTR